MSELHAQGVVELEASRFFILERECEKPLRVLSFVALGVCLMLSECFLWGVRKPVSWRMFRDIELEASQLSRVEKPI